MVPTSPYPNIAASYDLKIVGFRNPMSHFAPTVARCMSHLAHNSDCSFGDRRILFGNRKVTDSGRRSEEHTSELQSHVNLVCRLLLEKRLRPSPGFHRSRRYHEPLRLLPQPGPLVRLPDATLAPRQGSRVEHPCLHTCCFFYPGERTEHHRSVISDRFQR